MPRTATQTKPRGDAVLKTLPDALQEELWQFLRRNTQLKTAAWLKEAHDITTSSPALSAFYDWYPRSVYLRNAARTSDELAATLKKIPSLKLTAAQAAEVAQVNFEIQAAQDRDPVLYAALRKGEIDRDRLRLEREKFEHSKKSDVEKGLDALHDEIKGNAEALHHFEKLKAAVRKQQEAKP
jgi:hypothetical protein